MTHPCIQRDKIFSFSILLQSGCYNALGFSWSCESLWLATLDDRHHLDSLVSIGARWSPQRICSWPGSSLYAVVRDPLRWSGKGSPYSEHLVLARTKRERYPSRVLQRGLGKSADSSILRQKKFGGVLLPLLYIPHLLWAFHFVQFLSNWEHLEGGE
jgi:hypothetical protein